MHCKLHKNLLESCNQRSKIQDCWLKFFINQNRNAMIFVLARKCKQRFYYLPAHVYILQEGWECTYLSPKIGNTYKQSAFLGNDLPIVRAKTLLNNGIFIWQPTWILSSSHHTPRVPQHERATQSCHKGATLIDSS